MTPLHEAFKAAYLKYLEKKNDGVDARKPKMHFPDFHITRAPDTGRNREYLYVKDNKPYPDTKYLGKISPTGAFTSIPMDRFELEQLKDLIHTACESPLELTQEIGKETGTCCCCGRLLTNPLSVKLGIGPICRGNWFPDAPTLFNSLDANLEPIVKDTDDEALVKVSDLPTEMQADLENFYDIDKIPSPGSVTLVKELPEPTPIPDSKDAVGQLLDQYMDLSPADRIQFLSRVTIHEVTK